MGSVPDGSLQVAERTSQIVTVHSLKEAKDRRRTRVLLAEDNATNQKAAVRMLEKLGGYQVDVAVNGLEAVAACRDVDYGFVLMDSHMPEMDGLTAAREIRTFELENGRATVPIIALTANAMQGDREKCLAAGMTDYLSKPFKVVQLREVLDRLAQESGSAHALAVQDVAHAKQESAIDSRVFDDYREGGEGGGAHEFVVELIDQYLVDSASRMTILKDAIALRDASGLGRAAHSLNGSSSAVGANRMAGMCEELEMLARNATFDVPPELVADLEHEFARVRRALQIEQRTAP
jgi:CheY-like chemotaxis protein